MLIYRIANEQGGPFHGAHPSQDSVFWSKAERFPTPYEDDGIMPIWDAARGEGLHKKYAFAFASRDQLHNFLDGYLCETSREELRNHGFKVNILDVPFVHEGTYQCIFHVEQTITVVAEEEIVA